MNVPPSYKQFLHFLPSAGMGGALLFFSAAGGIDSPTGIKILIFAGLILLFFSGVTALASLVFQVELFLRKSAYSALLRAVADGGIGLSFCYGAGSWLSGLFRNPGVWPESGESLLLLWGSVIFLQGVALLDGILLLFRDGLSGGRRWKIALSAAAFPLYDFFLISIGHAVTGNFFFFGFLLGSLFLWNGLFSFFTLKESDS